jgi:hypothetical protein
MEADIGDRQRRGGLDKTTNRPLSSDYRSFIERSYVSISLTRVMYLLDKAGCDFQKLQRKRLDARCIMSDATVSLCAKKVCAEIMVWRNALYLHVYCRRREELEASKGFWWLKSARPCRVGAFPVVCLVSGDVAEGFARNMLDEAEVAIFTIVKKVDRVFGRDFRTKSPAVVARSDFIFKE